MCALTGIGCGNKLIYAYMKTSGYARGFAFHLVNISILAIEDAACFQVLAIASPTRLAKPPGKAGRWRDK